MGKRQIDPEAWYTLSDLVRLDAFPFCGTDIRRYRAAVKADLRDRNVLKTIVRGKGMAVRYSFKGSNVIRFIAAVEEARIQL